MRVQVTIIETKQIFRTYEVDGVNDLDTAKKCAQRCATHQFQPNTYLVRQVPYAPTYSYGAIEIKEC